MRLREIIGALRESGGGTVALNEGEIVVALRRLARQGLFAEPTSASAAAALNKLSDAGAIKAGETTIVILTGTGLKAATVVADLVQCGIRLSWILGHIRSRLSRPGQGKPRSFLRSPLAQA